MSSVNLNSICKFVHNAVKALDDACLNLLEPNTPLAVRIWPYTPFKHIEHFLLAL